MSDMRLIRFDINNVPWEGEVVDDDGLYSDDDKGPRWWTVDGLESDADAVWESYSNTDAPREIRPKTVMVRLRPATDAEIAKAEEYWKEAGERSEDERSAVATAFGKLMGR